MLWVRIPIKFYVPVLLVLILVAAGALYCHWILASDKSKTIEFGAAMIGGLTALYGLLLSIQQRRATLAAKFIERWNQPEFATYRAAVKKAIDTQSAKDLPPHVTGFVLSFWEEVAIAVQAKEADERLLKQFFYTPALRYFAACESFVADIRKQRNQPTAYVEYEKLYKRWLPRGT